MSACNLNAKHLSQIMNQFETNTKMKSLDLSLNTVSKFDFNYDPKTKEMHILSFVDSMKKFLTSNSELKSLNLSEMHLGHYALIFVDSIGDHKYLDEINLSLNFLNQAQKQYVLESLKIS